uniref:Uncharacterized protein n=1 Tax=Sexangularia sp. CB-2014 TaxID=1486929 RepID=A0A7S1VMC7_9EUKA|mmetsp:Transcript_6233/g.20339  ORF Transcript_6233/g.20339 Transcript_6233/m.20339 type:complete len:139 (+) Transcript_6233:69-485(+)
MDLRDLDRYKVLVSSDDRTLVGGPIGEIEEAQAREQAQVNAMRNVHTMQNAHGSGSAVGAGYFHRYRRTRSEELDRIAQLEAEKDRSVAQAAFEQQREAAAVAAAAKTAAKRAARLKARERKRKGAGVKRKAKTGGER